MRPLSMPNGNEPENRRWGRLLASQGKMKLDLEIIQDREEPLVSAKPRGSSLVVGI